VNHFCRVAIVTLSVATLSLDAGSQDTLVVRGHVVRQEIRGPSPMAGILVTLHRIGPAAAGAIDSLRTDRRGEFVFRIAADSASMYLATSRHAGIAYFAPPSRLGEPPGESEIIVFDTTHVTLPLRVSGRHLIVSAPDATGARELVEVFEIQNDTIVTQVSASRDRPTFRTNLPPGARNVRATQGDFTGSAVVVEGSTVLVLAPIAPGVRQLVLTYSVAPGVFPLALGLDAPAEVLEVLLEEAAGRVDGGALASLGAVTVEGREFVRFLGRDVPAGAPVNIVVPDRSAVASLPPWLPGVALGILSLGVVAVVTRRRAVVTGEPLRAAPGVSTAGGPSTWNATDIRQAIAGVDQLLESPGTANAARPALEAYREELQAALDHSLASPPGAP
jgi:hypothetical protein